MLRPALLLLSLAASARATDPPAPARRPEDESCVACHAGGGEMHPWEKLGCVQCQGGDGRRADKDGAHVQPRNGWPADERVLPANFDPPAVRFRNPSDLRVVEQTYGACHDPELSPLRTRRHGPTAGPLCAGRSANTR